MITFIAVVAVVLLGAAYSIGHYHGTQQCREEVKLTTEALRVIRGKDINNEKGN